MAIAIGLQLSDHVAGVAPVAPPGDSAVEELLDVSDALPPMVAFVGAQDTRFAERSLDLLTELRDSAGCADEQLIEADAVTTSTWKCDEEVEIVTYVLEDEGHVWFGSPDSRDPLWASQAMWEFFSAQ
jgi:poly(3-hydroxybutyrate) depolymerase